MSGEQHVGFLRNDPKSKVELLFQKDGWSDVVMRDDVGAISAPAEDAYVVRVWGLKPDGTSRVNEFRLRKSEARILKSLLEVVVK